MKRALFVLLAVLEGCSVGPSADGGQVGPGDYPPLEPGNADAGGGPCTVALVPDPRLPIASPSRRITVAALASGLPGIARPKWNVLFNGAPTAFANTLGGGGFAIDFFAPTAGIYDISLALDGIPSTCQPEPLALNVEAEGANTTLYRLRIVPPPSSGAPAMEKSILVKGGGWADIGAPDVARGQRTVFSITGPTGGVAAYVRFAPLSAPDAVVEAFADAAGLVDALVSPQPHSVLVIPSVDGVAPRRLAAWSPFAVSELLVGAGSVVTGTVRGPDAAPLAGARVQVAIEGVPSTLATTAADGGFAVRVEPASGAITIEVTPDPASGLPRLVATSQASTPGVSQLDLSVPVQIRYAANFARKNVAGMVVRNARREAIPGARVTFVGPMVAGMVVTGSVSATATGELHIAASADSHGVLPSVVVPAGRVSAVVGMGVGTLAVVELDLASQISEIAAPEMQPIALSVLPSSGLQGLAGATLELVPLGALAQAGAPTVHVVAQATGALSAALPAGGRFELRFRDPFGRGAPLVVPDREISTIATSYRLPPSIHLRGRAKLDGTQAMANAAVQLLCNGCSGVERNRPIAEAVSGITGQFVLAVPDPGTR